jgi:hypothetical protein
VFGFENLLLVFDLLPRPLQTDPNPVRHTLGFGYPAQTHQKNTLTFFRLLPRFGPLPAPHNRQVEGSNPSGPTILLIFIGFL